MITIYLEISFQNRSLLLEAPTSCHDSCRCRPGQAALCQFPKPCTSRSVLLLLFLLISSIAIIVTTMATTLGILVVLISTSTTPSCCRNNSERIFWVISNSERNRRLHRRVAVVTLDMFATFHIPTTVVLAYIFVLISLSILTSTTVTTIIILVN